MKAFFELIKETITAWSEDRASRLAAALAYYTIFSLAPLLLIAVAIAGFFFGRGEARETLLAEVQSLMGPTGAQAVETMLENVARPGAGLIATLIGVATLILGASGVFGQLKSALNTIWGVKPAPGRGIWGTIKDRLLSFAMVGGIAFLLLVSLVASTALSAINRYFSHLLPGVDFIWQLVDIGLSLVVTTLLFAVVYKVLPDVKIAWSDVWVGAGVTAVLFTLGE